MTSTPARPDAQVRPAVAPAQIRPAVPEDLDALVALESASFDSDRITRRQFRYMLARAQAVLLVATETRAAGAVEPRSAAEAAGAPADTSVPPLLGYVLVLFNRATSVARLYSIAVDARARGRGIGQALVAAAERATWDADRAYLRLEIRRDNLPSQRLFEGLGYRRFGVLSDYYNDHMEALRYEKQLSPDPAQAPARVPFYEQTLDFTCGASSLMMAMHALDPSVTLDRTLELRIWREATTIFMTSGHGGCGPFGLALAAHARGFRAEVFVNDRGVPLIDSVRSPEKKEVMRLVHEDMLAETARAGIPITYGTLGLDALEARFAAGAVPLVLISSYRIYAEKFPHWVVVTGFDRSFVYVHDPFVDYEQGESPLDSMNMPIQQAEFRRMARYGRAGLQAVVLVSQAGSKSGSRSGHKAASKAGSKPGAHADG
ncbi:MAG: GNAT family N-acetyltransferase/peptidase C39 family protein [Thiohalocapsa sp.]|uniref:GNAT family N-acetyltransferase/peptidase C39 family protein n=1 Tax=Thiohalocapsa sp. TaxID=2497641 RepID=UPI0026006EB9|nr:GNAT family N-acetyltransferase/peptidase C39 family protein [Thiohalocapsa sp.]MCG6942464.1 GNAT family N-acetyltransferase/peptidase C39 family protein [Thiohalocapsa sp.]